MNRQRPFRWAWKARQTGPRVRLELRVKGCSSHYRSQVGQSDLGVSAAATHLRRARSLEVSQDKVSRLRSGG